MNDYIYLLEQLNLGELLSRKGGGTGDHGQQVKGHLFLSKNRVLTACGQLSNVTARCCWILETLNLLIHHKALSPLKAYAVEIRGTSIEVLVAWRELTPISAVAQVSRELQDGSGYGCLQHLASQFQLAVEVTAAKACGKFCYLYVCDHKKHWEFLR